MLAIVIAIVGVAFLAHTAPFPFLLEAFRPAKSLWRVKPQPGVPSTLYLTFDDGPNPNWTPALLDALREQDVAPRSSSSTSTSRRPRARSSRGSRTKGMPLDFTVERGG